MSKDAYYFSHDSNARNDEKILSLRIKHGWEGYGLYWAIVEKLREATDYTLLTNYNVISFDLRADSSVIKSIINDFGLFVVEEDCFYSESLMDRMAVKDEKSEKARQAALKRWSNADAMQAHSETNANKKKVNENKEKEINYVQFVDLWNRVNDCSLRITDNKRKQVRARLDRFSETEIKESIINRSKDEWINGEGFKYKSNWDSFWRNDEKVERYLNVKKSLKGDNNKLRGVYV